MDALEKNRINRISCDFFLRGEREKETREKYVQTKTKRMYCTYTPTIPKQTKTKPLMRLTLKRKRSLDATRQNVLNESNEQATRRRGKKLRGREKCEKRIKPIHKHNSTNTHTHTHKCTCIHTKTQHQSIKQASANPAPKQEKHSPKTQIYFRHFFAICCFHINRTIH